MRAGHVLDRRRDGQQRRPGRELGHRRDRRDHRARAGVVELHVFHALGGLDADPARVEADALADDREVPPEGVLLARLARAHDDHLRRVVAPLPHRDEHAHAELAGSLLVDHIDPEAVLLRDRARLVGEHLGRQVVRRAVRERPGAVRAFADDPAPLGAARDRRALGIGARRDQDQFVELRGRRIDLVAIDRRGLEPAFDHAARDRLGDAGPAALDRGQRVQPDRHRAHAAAAQAPDRVRRHVDDGLAVDLLGRADADRQDPRGAHARRRARARSSTSCRSARRTRAAPAARRRNVDRARPAGPRTTGRPRPAPRGRRRALPGLIDDDGQLHERPPDEGSAGRQ